MLRFTAPAATLLAAGLSVAATCGTGCAAEKGDAAINLGGGDTAAVASAEDHGRHETGPFQGPKANTGRAIHYRQDGKSILTVSDDFKIPDTPAPHWQVVDSSGNVYLLKQFKIKGGTNRTVEVPAYVKDVANVQIWCSFAEVVLGEAPFAAPVR